MKRRFIVNEGPAPRGRGTHVAYGVHAVAARLAATPPQVEHIYLREDPSARVAALADTAAQCGILVSRVPAATLSGLCGSDQHQGVVATVPPFRYGELSEVVAGGADRILVLDQLRDPQNLGALLRSAEAAGFAAVVVPRDGAAGVTASVEKAAAGAAMRVPVVRVVNIARTLRELKAREFWIVGLAARAAADVFEFAAPERVALVLGGESGLRRLVQEECDQLMSIPMAGRTESLNASVAGALAMYALRRRPGSLDLSAKSAR
ncbi:MAG TPA: 23S rRNA (guanosine(2251)-2'-O)-methyltransferase RlmB [Candidatus Kryptonia bacterium]|nr:23S rRNA (guanosine(2251)-2'-O)-methyltransferase RlmB [Candidatus Kryptonia bacterium]